MNRFVLDASVALSWFVDVPIDPYAAQIRSQMIAGRSALVPRLWELELANGLLMAERKRIISASESGERFDEIDRLKKSRIQVEESEPPARDALVVGRTFQLTACDAIYLELARREGLTLATLARRLTEAAKAAGVRRT